MANTSFYMLFHRVMSQLTSPSSVPNLAELVDSTEIDLGPVNTIAFFDLSGIQSYICKILQGRPTKQNLAISSVPSRFSGFPKWLQITLNPLQSGKPRKAYEHLTSSYHRLLNHLKAHKSNPSTHANPLTLWGGHGDAIDLIMQKTRSPNLFESSSVSVAVLLEKVLLPKTSCSYSLQTTVLLSVVSGTAIFENHGTAG